MLYQSAVLFFLQIFHSGFCLRFYSFSSLVYAMELKTV